MKGKPEAVSFMIKNVCDVHSGVMFAIELQEGKEEMAKRKFADRVKSLPPHVFYASWSR